MHQNDNYVCYMRLILSESEVCSISGMAERLVSNFKSVKLMIHMACTYMKNCTYRHIAT